LQVKEENLERIEALLQTISETMPIKDVVRLAGFSSIIKRWKQVQVRQNKCGRFIFMYCLLNVGPVDWLAVVVFMFKMA